MAKQCDTHPSAINEDNILQTNRTAVTCTCSGVSVLGMPEIILRK